MSNVLDMSNHGRPKKGEHGLAADFATKLNTVPSELGKSLLLNIHISSKIAACTPPELVYVDALDNCVYGDNGVYKTKSLITLRQYKISNDLLSSFMEVERTIPDFEDGSYFFFRAQHQGTKCLASMAGRSKDIYIVLHETDEGAYPSENDSSFIFSMYSSDLEGPVLIESVENGKDELIASISLGQMIMQSKDKGY